MCHCALMDVRMKASQEGGILFPNLSARHDFNACVFEDATLPYGLVDWKIGIQAVGFQPGLVEEL